MDVRNFEALAKKVNDAKDRCNRAHDALTEADAEVGRATDAERQAYLEFMSFVRESARLTGGGPSWQK